MKNKKILIILILVLILCSILFVNKSFAVNDNKEVLDRMSEFAIQTQGMDEILNVQAKAHNRNVIGTETIYEKYESKYNENSFSYGRGMYMKQHGIPSFGTDYQDTLDRYSIFCREHGTNIKNSGKVEEVVTNGGSITLKDVEYGDRYFYRYVKRK